MKELAIIGGAGFVAGYARIIGKSSDFGPSASEALILAALLGGAWYFAGWKGAAVLYAGAYAGSYVINEELRKKAGAAA